MSSHDGSLIRLCKVSDERFESKAAAAGAAALRRLPASSGTVNRLWEKARQEHPDLFCLFVWATDQVSDIRRWDESSKLEVQGKLSPGAFCFFQLTDSQQSGVELLRVLTTYNFSLKTIFPSHFRAPTEPGRHTNLTAPSLRAFKLVSILICWICLKSISTENQGHMDGL